MVEINRSNIHYFAIGVIVIITLLLWLLAFYIKKTVRHEITHLKTKAKQIKPTMENSHFNNDEDMLDIDNMNNDDYYDIDSYIDPLADIGVSQPIHEQHEQHEQQQYERVPQQPPQQYEKLTHDNILMRDMMDGSIKN
jgi:hypothetical protein